MTNATLHMRVKAIDHLTGNAVWTPPANLYLALLKTLPAAGDTYAANSAKELEVPGANGYSRQLVTLGAADANGLATLTAQVTFGPSTTGWAQIVGGWIMDAATGSGNLWLQGAPKAPRTIGAAGSLIIDVGGMTFSAI